MTDELRMYDDIIDDDYVDFIADGENVTLLKELVYVLWEARGLLDTEDAEKLRELAPLIGSVSAPWPVGRWKTAAEAREWLLSFAARVSTPALSEGVTAVPPGMTRDQWDKWCETEGGTTEETP